MPGTRGRLPWYLLARGVHRARPSAVPTHSFPSDAFKSDSSAPARKAVLGAIRSQWVSKAESSADQAYAWCPPTSGHPGLRAAPSGRVGRPRAIVYRANAAVRIAAKSPPDRAHPQNSAPVDGIAVTMDRSSAGRCGETRVSSRAQMKDALAVGVPHQIPPSRSSRSRRGYGCRRCSADRCGSVMFRRHLDRNATTPSVVAIQYIAFPCLDQLRDHIARQSIVGLVIREGIHRSAKVLRRCKTRESRASPGWMQRT